MTQSNIDLTRHEEDNKKDRPIASREKIYALLEQPLSIQELLDSLPEANSTGGAVHNRVLAMVRDQQLVINHDIVSRKETSKLITEKVMAKAGQMFVLHQGERINLSERHSQGLFPNDEVVLRVPSQLKEDSIAILVSINTASVKHLICVVKYRRNKLVIVPFDQRIKQTIVMKGVRNYPANTVLKVKRSSQQRSKRVIEVVESENLGDIYQTGIERAIAQEVHGLSGAWSQDLHIDGASQASIEKEAENRESWTHLPFVTIDGEDAKDYDDAVYAEKTDTGYRLYVAIADVSHYVLPDTTLDLDARQRGNSVY